MVEQTSDDGPGDQHEEGSAREQQALRPRRGNQGDGGEDDVRPETEGKMVVRRAMLYVIFINICNK